MSQKRKRGLQRGLSDIVEKQTAPVDDRSRQSADLISKFAEPKHHPLPPPPTTSYHQPPPTKETVAPSRDFAKVANSIARDAVPAGLFKGASKKLYDALYQRTRGAIQPTREIHAKHSELMEWAKVSHNTLRAHLRHLETVGLVIRKWEVGDNTGVNYEVFIPEEIEASYHLLPPPTTPTTSYQKLVPPSTQKLVGGGRGQVVEESTSYELPKTLIKTYDENDDDEAFAAFNEVLRKATVEVTGKQLSKTDAARWQELAEVLVAELKIAAARTTVSSVPSFLAEHLRRRLWKLDKKQARAQGRELPDEAISAPPVQQSEEASRCPDCRGSGWWYPDGADKGVAKCRHAKLEQVVAGTAPAVAQAEGAEEREAGEEKSIVEERFEETGE